MSIEPDSTNGDPTVSEAEALADGSQPPGAGGAERFAAYPARHTTPRVLPETEGTLR